MKKDSGALSFSEKERICENTFINNEPYWHLFTDGTRMQNIFRNEDEFKVGMWSLATSLHLHKDVRLLTFALMSNHIHLILSGRQKDCIEIFNLFSTRIKTIFSKANRAIDWKPFEMNIQPIENLQSLRNEIIYVNRNAFVANPTHTPDSYLWGGGCAYFSSWLQHLCTSPLSKLTVNTQRKLLHTRDVAPFSGLLEIGSMPFIPSFCDIKLGESLFRDARSYFNSLTRNAEAFSQIAARIKDSVFLTDDELYVVLNTFIHKEYAIKSTTELTAQQKIDTARHLHFNYNASNQQLRRMLRMDIAILEELFPQ
jgi:REP element-mobilizing transposase RayT